MTRLETIDGLPEYHYEDFGYPARVRVLVGVCDRLGPEHGTSDPPVGFSGIRSEIRGASV